MKVLIISTQYPLPKDNGKKIILASIFNYFVDSYGKDNVEYMIVGSDQLDVVPEVKVSLINKPGVLNQMKNIFVYSGFLRKKSIQESVLYSKETRNRLINYIENEKFELVIYDTIRISQLFEGHKFQNTRQFVYLDDLFSVRYEKMINSMTEFPDIQFNPIGNFSKFLPKFARGMTNFQFINKLLLKLEKELIKMREIETAKAFPNSLLISEQEVKLLKERSNSKTVKSIRPIVVNSFEKKEIQRSFKGDPNFVFLGALNIPHNDVSISYFIKRNIDNLIREIPNVKISIIGKNPSHTLMELAKQYPDQVKILGFVEDLDLIFNECCAMIVPLLFGSGVKLKTLEAFARGLPVIATDYGVEGIDLPLNGECIVENEIEKFISHMKELTDIEANNRMSNLAFEFFVDQYSKKAVYKQYDRVFAEKS